MIKDVENNINIFFKKYFGGPGGLTLSIKWGFPEIVISPNYPL